jgi:hypothetical protein
VTGAAETGGEKKQGDFTLPTFDVANPDDLRETFRQAGRQVIGYAPDDNEVNQMVMAYQQMQIGRQRRLSDLAFQQAAAQEAGQMGMGPEQIIEAEESEENFARRRYEETHPFDAAAVKGAGQMEAVLGFLRGGR